jgi:hypothetical protein
MPGERLLSMPIIKGIGWIKKIKYGCKNRRLCGKYSDLKSLYTQLQKEIFKYPIENFGRFNHDSRLAILAIALALYDAGIVYAKDKKQDISILGTNTSAALDANLAYFNDYVANGKVLGRGNLFIYTLPSSTLAEAAIHFGLTGELLYAGFLKGSRKQLLNYAKDLLKSGSSKTMVVVNSGPKEATCFVLQKSK